MPIQTYPDGFPQSALEAIEFSYFLSDAEKEDWKNWLTTSTPEQQFELVDTLHAMWQENQKSAIPSGFIAQGQDQTQQAFLEDPASTLPQAQAPAQTQSQPSPTQIQSESTRPAPSAIEDSNNSILPSTTQNIGGISAIESQSPNLIGDNVSSGNGLVGESFVESLIQPNSDNQAYINQPNGLDKATTKTSSSTQSNGSTTKQSTNDIPKKVISDSGADYAAKAFGSGAYSQNPLLQEIDDIQQTNQTSSTTKLKPMKPKEEEKASPTQFFNVTKIRESATQQELQELYDQYLDLRESSFGGSRSFYEAQGKFLDKVMAVVVNFEKVADFFDALSAKIIEINDNVTLKINELNASRATTLSQFGDLADEVETLRVDVDRLIRTSREDKSDTRRKLEDLSSRITAIDTDTFSHGDGLLQRFDLITSRLHKLELKMTREGFDKSTSSDPANNRIPQAPAQSPNSTKLDIKVKQNPET